jgi:hypothetical protein
MCSLNPQVIPVRGIWWRGLAVVLLLCLVSCKGPETSPLATPCSLPSKAGTMPAARLELEGFPKVLGRSENAPPVWIVSVAALLADPGRFHGEHVQVVGFLSLGEQDYLMLDRDSLSFGITANGLLLDLAEVRNTWSLRSDATGSCCIIIASVDATDRGPVGVSSCRLRVEQFAVLERRK